ncbi:MAG: cellulase family glycosylhydrolase [Dehalococcoidia bacterium]|nr:cellulase family glycosylhydrolase [Dehalococcoidia bacterium]
MSNPSQSVPVRGIGYGVISEPSRQDSVADLGFAWVKYLIYWKDAQPQKGGTVSFDPYDDWVNSARARGLRVMLRVDDPPSWATGSREKNAPPLNDNDLAEFMYQLALHFKGRVEAWELWNEPNLNYEWGYQRPDPAKFARMLRAVYPRVKAADPQTLLIVGGLSTTGGDFDDTGNEGHIGDLGYLKALAQAGAQGFFDAIGSHPYGGPYPPEQDYEINNTTTPVGLYFRRAELQHEAWLRATGQDVAIWVTEFGWIQDFGWNCTWADAGSPWGRQAQKVSPQQQADYLVRAFQYAQAHWPWMGPMIIFNLDKALDTPAACDNNYERFFGILNPNGSPTPAYTALKAMSKTDNLAPVSTMGALPFFSPGSFTVSWSSDDNPGGAGVQSHDLQRRVDSGPWTDLLTGATLTSTVVSGSDGQRLSFRVRAQDRLGNRESFRSEDGDVSTTVDVSPPASEVLAYSFPVTSTASFPVRWSGTDGGSGVGSYDIQYRDGPAGDWTNLKAATSLTQTNFLSGLDRHTYEFRSRSRDRMGNLEEYPASPDSQMLVSFSPYITNTTTPSPWMGERGQTLPLQVLRLTNAGNSPTPFQASSDASWLTVTPASGSIAAGGAVSLTLSVTTPLTGAGTAKLDADVIVTGTAAWNSPAVFSSSLYAVDSLHTTYFPILPKQASGW